MDQCMSKTVKELKQILEDQGVHGISKLKTKQNDV